MIKKLILPILIMLISACGGGGGNTNSGPTSVPAGIYTGTVTPTGGTADSAVAIITSEDKVTLVDIDTREAFIGTVSGISLTGTMYASTSVPASATVTTVSGNNISGTYTSSLGGGTFALVADPNLYSRTSSLSKLTGTWVDSVFTNVVGTTTWVIQADGTYAVSSTSGCTATGSFAVFNSLKNEYNLNMTIANCTGFNGTYTGFAVISDTSNTDDTLSLIFNNGSIGGMFEPLK